MTYDPFQRTKIINSRRFHHPAEGECFIVKESLEKNYCIEALPITSAYDFDNIFKLNPDMKGRYAYLANLSHGGPGIFSAQSKCKYQVMKQCEGSLEYDTCFKLGIASQRNKDVCLCYAERVEILKVKQIGNLEEVQIIILLQVQQVQPEVSIWFIQM